VEQQVVVAVVALVEWALLQDPQTARARLGERDYRTLFLERLLHMQREAPEARVTVALTERLVQRTEVMADKAVMVIQLQMAETEGLVS
jgi:hypothetical protein